MVGEGGNLGFTQLGRVEYALAGGLVYTDAIDNSAGVDCSDHEVNIKILLDGVVDAGELTTKQRNDVLASMTDEVAELVLDNNEAQTLALVIARRQALPMVNVHARYIDVLETEGWLDRALEFLPTDKQIAERQAAGAGLQAPELAVLIAYTKNANVAEIVQTDLPDVALLEADLVDYFPPALRTRYADAIRAAPAAPGDHRHPARQPDGQPVGDLVRPPHDRGHRRLGRRRHPGLDRRPRGPRLPAPVGRDRRARRARSPLDVQLDLFLDCRRMAERARCGCCATAARRSTSPPRSPSSGPASPSWPRRWSRCSSAGWPTSCAPSRRRG